MLYSVQPAPPAPAPVDADTLWDFIVQQLPKQIQRYADDLQAELLNTGGLILLDGLDEVPNALKRREQVKQAVQGFATIYTRCRFLVTSRTYAYQRQDWKLNGFAEMELLPFTRGQIERFIGAWYEHMVQLYRLTQTDADVRAEVLRGTEACHKVRPQAFWHILSWLTGQNLIATPIVSLNDIVLGDAHLINPNTISATLPAGIPVGDYDIWLSNPNGQSGVLLHALHVGRPLYLPTVMID